MGQWRTRATATGDMIGDQLRQGDKLGGKGQPEIYGCSRSRLSSPQLSVCGGGGGGGVLPYKSEGILYGIELTYPCT